MQKISIIAAIADNYGIGVQNGLPWHLPADMKRFKELTTGHAVIMGKRTYESLPNGSLPERKNIVLSSILEGNYEKYYEAVSLRDAIDLCEHESEVFVIGGGKVFNQAIDYPGIDTMYITWIHQEFESDVFFPKIDEKEWKEVSREDFKADKKNHFDYSFVEYNRIK